jgi:hypothetical protein
MEAAGRTINTELGPPPLQVQMQHQAGVVKIYGGAFTETLALEIYQRIFHLERREMAVV